MLFVTVPNPNLHLARHPFPQLRCHRSSRQIFAATLQQSNGKSIRSTSKKTLVIQTAQVDFTWFNTNYALKMQELLICSLLYNRERETRFVKYIINFKGLLMTRPHLPVRSQWNHPFWPCRATAPRNRTCRGHRARAATPPRPASEWTTSTRLRPLKLGSVWAEGAATMVVHPKLKETMGKMRISPRTNWI